MSAEKLEEQITPNYKAVDLNEKPDFSQARLTGVILSQEDEDRLRIKVGQAIDAGNNLAGYSRRELAQLCDIKSAQFSKIVKGEAWLNLGNLGLWSFATGISPTELVTLAPLNAAPSLCITWFMNGHLHHLEHDEFELFTKLICSRLNVQHHKAQVTGDEPIPKLRDKNWQDMYLTDLTTVGAKHFRELRETLGLSQASLGDALGITPETVKRYESGNVRANKGVFSTYRLFVTTNVSPIEITKGSIHHRLRYVQEQRHEALHAIAKQIDYQNYRLLKDITLKASAINP